MTQTRVGAEECSALGAPGRTFEAYANREASLGRLPVSRALPVRNRRLVGPWCFLDRFGPLAFGSDRPMNVPPHPHIGLQTVSWLLEGEVLHSDSLGSEALLRPGGVNVMTAGRGIAHAEETPPANGGRLNGVQLWVALPDAQRNTAPSFVHVPRVPIFETPGGTIQVFAGAYGGEQSPAPHFSELIGLDVAARPGRAVEPALNEECEHALLLLEGDCWFEDRRLEPGVLYYLGARRSGLALTGGHAGGRALLIGGRPFPEKILMWWNFVARTPEEIAGAAADWEAQRRFGAVVGHHAPRLAAPALMHFAAANPVS